MTGRAETKVAVSAPVFEDASLMNNTKRPRICH